MKAKRVTNAAGICTCSITVYRCGGGSSENKGGIKEFTAFFAVPGLKSMTTMRFSRLS